MRGILLACALALCAGCVMVDEADRGAASFIDRALPERPDLADPVAEALSKRLGPPKVVTQIDEAGRDAVLGAVSQPKSRGLNLLGKLLLSALTLGLTIAGVTQPGGTGCDGENC